MKKQFVFFLTVLSLILISSVGVSAATKVSVYVDGNISALQQQIVNNAFMNRLSTSKKFEVFERNEAFIKAMTREHDYQTAGDVPESQIRKIAAKYGVDYVIAVTVMTDEASTYMSARLIDIESGKVEKTVSQDRDSSTNTTLKNLSNNVAYRLIGGK